MTGCACDHDNPLCRCHVSDPERAARFGEFLDALSAGGIDADRLRFMPLSGEEKTPWIEGNARLESERADLMLHTAAEAHTALSHGHPGFALYFGREDHGTEGVLSVDNDEPEFPVDEMPDTGLKVMSGSGNFPGHYYYRNDGSVQNAAPSFGEVRASNQYTVTPGSVHPSGGIYHTVEGGAPTEIGQDDLPESLHPSMGQYDPVDHENIETTPPEDLQNAEFRNEAGQSLESLRERDRKLDDLLTHLDPSGYGYDGDTSVADAATVSKLWWYRFDQGDIYDIVRKYRSRRKAERDDYWWKHTIRKFAQGEQMSPPGSRETTDFKPTEWTEEFAPGWSVTVPTTTRAEAIAAGWNWMRTDEPEITREDVYERNEAIIHGVMDWGENALLDAPMSSGKTFTSFKVAAARGEPMTYLTARKDLYEQAERYARQHGLSYYNLPSISRHCPSYQGEHGEAVEERVKGAYFRGATPEQIHEHMNLPCGGTGGDEDEDDDGPTCPYHARCNFDPDEFDVLIGHFSHAHLPQVLAGRHVVVDENPGDSLREALEGDALTAAVNTFCEITPEFPAADMTEILERRREPEFLEAALDFFEGLDLDEMDPAPIFAHEDYHAAAPLAAHTILTSSPAGNTSSGYPFEYTRIPQTGAIGVYVRCEEGGVVVQNPPSQMNMARSVLCLDGTPLKSKWEGCTGLRLARKEPLETVEERASYYHNTLDIDVFLTSMFAKPYSSGEWVTVEKDRAVASAIADTVGEPVVVSALKAVNQYREDGWDEEDGPAKALDNFANLRGSNRYADEEVALISGSPHYGDRWVQLEAAFQNKAVFPDGKGTEKEYEGGEDIAEQMREAVILQTILRFGRDTETGAAVYLNTNVVPDQIDIAGTGTVQKTFTESQRTIFEVAEEHAERYGEVTAPEVHDDPRVECHRRTVQRTLAMFERHGMFAGKDRDGRRVVYVGWDDEPHRLTRDGIATIPGVEDDSNDSDSSHTVVYMPLFGVPPPEPEFSLPEPAPRPPSARADAVDPPPD